MIRSYGLTDIGLRRQLNQDRVYTSDTPVGPLPNLYIVADGMGGHNAGELASAITVRVMEDELKSMSDVSPEEALEAAKFILDWAENEIETNGKQEVKKK